MQINYINLLIYYSVRAKLLVFGNPLLDVTVQVQDDELLRKYGLEKNGQKEVSVEKLQKLFEDARARYNLSIKPNFGRIHLK